jgi:hypothetical protein
MAVSHAASGKTSLGSIVLRNGRDAMAQRLQPMLEAARDAELLAFDTAEDAFRTFYGLVLRDTQVRLLLGDTFKLTPAQIAAESARATRQFLALHGAGNTSPHLQTERKG